MGISAPATPPGDAAGPADRGSTVDVRAAGVEPGRTTVADVVVQKIAGRAALEISGVHGFGGGAGRTFGAITERIPGARATAGRGVTVEVGEKQAAIDLDIVVEYGSPIAALTQAIRLNVSGAVELMTGLDVVEININVNDVHLPGDGNDAADTTADAVVPRVR
jgi:uncharacterized alkaline shock family protein YloU